MFIKGRNILLKNFSQLDYDSSKETTIGNDVWIGSNVLIKAGIKIGTGAIIGMGSVVTSDVAEYTIVGGSPAKVIRNRFNEQITRGLLESAWWDFNDEKLKSLSDSISDPVGFLERISKFE